MHTEKPVSTTDAADLRDLSPSTAAAHHPPSSSENAPRSPSASLNRPYCIPPTKTQA